MSKELEEKPKIKVFLLVNVLTSVSSLIYRNHIEFMRWTAFNRPDIQFYFMPLNRTSIDNARNGAAKHALEYGCDYLFFIDDDVMVPPNCLDKLLHDEKDIKAGLVIIRGYPFNVMAFKFDTDSNDQKRNLGFYNDLPLDADGKLKHGLVECDAVGFSCALIKCSLLKQMSPPFFVTGASHTEDVFFCMEAKQQTQNKVQIYMDPSIQCGHMLTPEIVEWGNREKLKEFYSDVADGSYKMNRKNEWVKANKEALAVAAKILEDNTVVQK